MNLATAWHRLAKFTRDQTRESRDQVREQARDQAREKEALQHKRLAKRGLLLWVAAEKGVPLVYSNNHGRWPSKEETERDLHARDLRGL